MVEKQATMTNTDDRILLYDNHTKKLKIVQKQKLVDPHIKDRVIAHRTYTDEYDEAGIKEMIRSFNAQKNEYEHNIKTQKEILKEMESLDVDEEFVRNYENYQRMKQKIGTQESLENNEHNLKLLNKQLNEIKDKVKNYIKI